MVLAAIATAAIYAAWPSGTGILIITEVMNVAVAVWIFRMLPEFGGGSGGGEAG
jgi:hypothetical protein